MPIASVVRGSSKNEKMVMQFWYKILDELSASSRLFDFSVATEFAGFQAFALRTIPRRFLWKKRQENERLVIHVTTITTENTSKLTRFRLFD